MPARSSSGSQGEVVIPGRQQEGSSVRPGQVASPSQPLKPDQKYYFYLNASTIVHFQNESYTTRGHLPLKQFKGVLGSPHETQSTVLNANTARCPADKYRVMGML